MPKKYGSRQEVFEGISEMTRGGLTKADLMVSRGKIVSKKKSEAAKASYAKYGFAKRQRSPVAGKPAEKKRRRRKKVVISEKDNVVA